MNTTYPEDIDSPRRGIYSKVRGRGGKASKFTNIRKEDISNIKIVHKSSIEQLVRAADDDTQSGEQTLRSRLGVGEEIEN